ncbi:hypothetical protein METH_07800 [Leisingera methylohalidivorans DSM 14336]|uniref:Uncharacterized protein n=1 Tax=Leisingera methylohalidivorans DSM 14336 TaxID=999552 RepID=V9VYG1_9RHOB|nr:hypothetical protein METH_07800 [Leisingera methylohalidivorans DSM 14336]
MPSQAGFAEYLKIKGGLPWLAKLVFFAAAVEIGLVYYVVYEPDYYLQSKSRYLVPSMVWLFLPVLAGAVVYDVKKVISRN